MGGLEYFLSLFWGFLWAAVLQFTKLGRFLAEKRTWVTVVIGVGGDLAIALGVVEWDAWWRVALIVVASSAGVIFRSLWNEQREARKERASRPRLPNKVQWNLDDIQALCPRMQEGLREAEGLAKRHGDSALLAELAGVSREVERVLRKARDARYGEYAP